MRNIYFYMKYVNYIYIGRNYQYKVINMMCIVSFFGGVFLWRINVCNCMYLKCIYIILIFFFFRYYRSSFSLFFLVNFKKY